MNRGSFPPYLGLSCSRVYSLYSCCHSPGISKRVFGGQSVDWQKWAHIATIFSVLVGAATIVVAGWTFIYNANVQAEDTASRSVQEHIKLWVEHPELNDTQRQLRLSPEDLADPAKVSDEDYDHYRNLAIHGLGTLETIFVTRGDQEGWRNSVAGWVHEYEAIIRYGDFICEDYNPDFVDFIAETLNLSREDFCVDRNAFLEQREEAKKEKQDS